MASSVVEIRLTEWPEALAAIRLELVKLLREEADSDADPRVAKRLRDVALRFEIGLTAHD